MLETLAEKTAAKTSDADKKTVHYIRLNNEQLDEFLMSIYGETRDQCIAKGYKEKKLVSLVAPKVLEYAKAYIAAQETAE